MNSNKDQNTECVRFSVVYGDTPNVSEGTTHNDDKPYFDTTEGRGKPYAPPFVAQHYINLKNDTERDHLDELNEITKKYYLDARIFEGSNGMKGLKDCLDTILVPAHYDGFDFLPNTIDFPRPSVIAIRDEKYVVVTLDSSGKELCEPCDEIRLVSYRLPHSPYVYRRNGLLSWGFMDLMGHEMCDCIVDDFDNQAFFNVIWFRSGDYMGLWSFDFYIFLDPIYDSIEMSEDSDTDPFIFTLKGVKGYVKLDGTFVPLEEIRKMDEDDQYDFQFECLRIGCID